MKNKKDKKDEKDIKYEFIRVYSKKYPSRYIDFIVWKNQWGEWQRRVFRDLRLYINLSDSSKEKLLEYMQEDVDQYFNSDMIDRTPEEKAFQKFLKKEKKNMDQYIIYTDGACRKNPGKGASAYVILDSSEKNIIKYESYYYPDCTNNYAELMAIIKALKFVSEEIQLNKNLNITIKSDSKYCVDGCNKWMYDWNKKETLTNQANGEVWENLYFLIQDVKSKIHKLEFTHIKGHSGVKWNEYCDKLVNETIDEYE